MLRPIGFITTVMLFMSHIAGREKRSHLDIYLTPETFLRGYEFVDKALKEGAKFVNDYPSKRNWIIGDEIKNQIKDSIKQSDTDSSKAPGDESSDEFSFMKAYYSLEKNIKGKFNEIVEGPLFELLYEVLDNFKIVEIYHDKYDLHPPQIMGPHSLKIRTPALSMFLETSAKFLGINHHFGCQVHGLIMQADATFSIADSGDLAVNLKNVGLSYEKFYFTSKEIIENLLVKIFNNDFVKSKIVQYLKKQSFTDLAVQMLNNIYTFEFENKKDKPLETEESINTDNLKLQFGITELPHFYTTHASEIFHFSVTFNQIEKNADNLFERKDSSATPKAPVVKKRVTKMENFESANTNYSENFDEFIAEVGLNSFKELSGANEKQQQQDKSK